MCGNPPQNETPTSNLLERSKHSCLSQASHNFVEERLQLTAYAYCTGVVRDETEKVILPAESATAPNSDGCRARSVVLCSTRQGKQPQSKARTYAVSEMHSTTSYDHLVKLLVIGDSGEPCCLPHFEYHACCKRIDLLVRYSIAAGMLFLVDVMIPYVSSYQTEDLRKYVRFIILIFMCCARTLLPPDRRCLSSQLHGGVPGTAVQQAAHLGMFYRE